MAFQTSQLWVRMDNIIQADDNEMPEADRIQRLRAAIERYSSDLPDEITADVTGDAGRYYSITTALTSWKEGLSRIVSIEYPAQAISADETPQYLEPDDWDDDYWAGGVRYLFLPNHAPASTETMRIRYTAPYIESSSAYDIPEADVWAVCNLAAGLCCQAIAVKYSRTSDSTITGDSVDHGGRADRFASRARELIREYERHIGIRRGDSDGATVRAAGEFVDWDTAPGGNRRRWLTHRNR